MLKLRLPHRIIAHRSSAASAPVETPVDHADAVCALGEDLVQAGAAPRSPWVFTDGIPILALGMLAASGLMAALDSSPGGLSLLAAGLLVLAAIPWLLWLVRGDDGPSWPFTLAALTPVGLLAASHWFSAAVGPESGFAALLLAFPSLLVAMLGIIFAPSRLAIGMTIASYLAFGGPLLAALIAGRDVSGTLIITWHMGFALTAVAAYAIRLSNETHRVLADAQAAQARQEITEERRRVARDVHDVVAHTLAVTMLHITAARMAVRRDDPAEAEAALEEAERQGRASLADIRRVVRLLRADDLSALDAAQPGLRDIDALIAGYRSAGLPVTLTRSLNGHRASDSAELALFRVLQEALTNAARHGTGPATVALDARADQIALTISNPLDRARPGQDSGSGLSGMRERITAAGGRLETGVENGHWIVRATVPAGAAG